jgi:hypothetical protein
VCTAEFVFEVSEEKRTPSTKELSLNIMTDHRKTDTTHPDWSFASPYLASTNQKSTSSCQSYSVSKKTKLSLE